MRMIAALVAALVVGGCCTKMPEVPEPQTLPTPEFGRIRNEAGRATEDAIRLLWLGVNANLRSSSRLNLRQRQQQEQFEALFNWSSVPFNAGDYSGLGGTWTVESADLVRYEILTVNDLAFLWLVLNSTTTSLDPSALIIDVPFTIDFTSAAALQTVGSAVVTQGAGLTVLTSVPTINNSTSIALRRTDATTYPNATDTLHVSVTARMKIIP